MNTERGKAILKLACMNYTEFSELVGVKPITVRLAFSNKRLSKKMVAKLLELEEPQKEEEEKSEGGSCCKVDAWMCRLAVLYLRVFASLSLFLLYALSASLMTISTLTTTTATTTSLLPLLLILQ